MAEGGGGVSAAPVGWRERRFVVAIWIDLLYSRYIYRITEAES